MTFINNGLQDPEPEMYQLMKKNGVMNRNGVIDFYKIDNIYITNSNRIWLENISAQNTTNYG